MLQKGEIKPKTAPNLNIPPGNTCVEISIINTTTDIVCPSENVIQPLLKGNEILNLPTYAYFIRHPSGKQALFDLGGRKDWWNSSPVTASDIRKAALAVNIPKGIDEILREGCIDVNGISSLIWSHWHWDHTGDPSLFPSAELVVGPGFKKAFMPGYPRDPDGILLESDFAGREVREIDFSANPSKIGGFDAHDFFGDGSLYILNSQGHAIGHISALARTTKDTFVFLGGDVCHHGGCFRPTPYRPMPEKIPASVPLDRARRGALCPCSMFIACHPDPNKARTKPYFHVSRGERSWYIEPEAAQQSVSNVELFDADDNVFVAIAHDEGLGRVCEFFPNSTMNQWKEKGWKEPESWAFLNALPVDGKPARGWLAPGLIREGKIEERCEVKPVRHTKLSR